MKKTIDQMLGLDDATKKEKTSLWTYRKRTVMATLFFCAFSILYVMHDGTDSNLNNNIVLGCLGLAGSVIGMFIGGQSWHDVNIKKIQAVEEIRQAEVTGGKTRKKKSAVEEAAEDSDES